MDDQEYQPSEAFLAYAKGMGMLVGANRIKSLRSKIMYYRKRYYVDDDPDISDCEYDILSWELAALEIVYPSLMTSDSPTRFVGSSLLGSYKESRKSCCWHCLSRYYGTGVSGKYVRYINQEE